MGASAVNGACQALPFPPEVIQLARMIVEGRWTGKIIVNFVEGAYINHDLGAHFDARTQGKRLTPIA